MNNIIDTLLESFTVSTFRFNSRARAGRISKLETNSKSKCPKALNMLIVLIPTLMRIKNICDNVKGILLYWDFPSSLTGNVLLPINLPDPFDTVIVMNI